jgi:hypothetical protein
MENGWKYLEQFNTGVLEATGKKTTLKHVFVTFEVEAEKRSLNCLINGSVDPGEMKDLPIRTEFMVRIKCANKETGIYLTTKGKACVREIGHGPEGLQVKLEIKISSIAAYEKITDEKGIEALQPIYNDLTTREHKKAKAIEGYR